MGAGRTKKKEGERREAASIVDKATHWHYRAKYLPDHGDYENRPRSVTTYAFQIKGRRVRESYTWSYSPADLVLVKGPF